MPIAFKTDRIRKEFDKLTTKNWELRQLLVDLNEYTELTFKKNITITMIDRTQEEQDAIYRGTVRRGRSYDKIPWKSWHQFWIATDIRTRNFTIFEIKNIVNYLNRVYTGVNKRPKTATFHEVTKADGTKMGKHFHIEFEA